MTSEATEAHLVGLKPTPLLTCLHVKFQPPSFETKVGLYGLGGHQGKKNTIYDLICLKRLHAKFQQPSFKTLVVHKILEPCQEIKIAGLKKWKIIKITLVSLKS